MLLKIWSICPAEASEEIWIWTLMLSSGSGRRFFTASPPSSTKPGLTLGVFAVAFVAAVLFCVGAAFVTAASVGRLQAALAREGRPPTLAKAPCSRLGSCLMRRVRSTSPPEACGLESNANQQVRAYVQERLGGSPTIIPTRCTGGLYGRAYPARRGPADDARNFGVWARSIRRRIASTHAGDCALTGASRFCRVGLARSVILRPVAFIGQRIRHRAATCWAKRSDPPRALGRPGGL